MTGTIWLSFPLVWLAGGAFAVYLVARFVTRRNEALASLTALFFAAALLTVAPLFSELDANIMGQRPFSTWGRYGQDAAFLRADPGALLIIVVALALGLLVAIYSGRYLALDKRYETYYPLLLLLVFGLAGMVLTADLFNLYLFCELMSVSAYALVAFRRHLSTAIEAGLKYLVMGSVGTVTMLLGISFVYRATGDLFLPPLGSWAAAVQPDAGSVWLRAGVACLLLGLGVKSAIVPLHTWLPDAHGRAPSSISAMLSGIVVQSAFYTLLKVTMGLGYPPRQLGTLLLLLSLGGMVVGNALALVQVHTKRLLAYSTIAQMSYVMLSVGVGLRYGLPAAVQAGFFLLVAHAAMKGLAFLCKGAFHYYVNATRISDLRGGFASLPLVSVAFTISLAGLAGLPPLAGFASKWFILTGSLAVNDVLGYVSLVTFLLNSLLALAYYLPLIGTLYARGQDTTLGTRDAPRIRVSYWMLAPIVALALLVMGIGLYPQPCLRWVSVVSEYLSHAGR